MACSHNPFMLYNINVYRHFITDSYYFCDYEDTHL